MGRWEDYSSDLLRRLANKNVLDPTGWVSSYVELSKGVLSDFGLFLREVSGQRGRPTEDFVRRYVVHVPAGQARTQLEIELPFEPPTGAVVDPAGVATPAVLGCDSFRWSDGSGSLGLPGSTVDFRFSPAEERPWTATMVLSGLPDPAKDSRVQPGVYRARVFHLTPPPGSGAEADPRSRSCWGDTIAVVDLVLGVPSTTA
ncbi:MAG: hypothetical protein IPK07_13295 [Deltaproteobacteria bacterium]|nr:hypothetical protein [Deltaproteobacteria bacterium]